MTGNKIDPLARKFCEPRYFEDFEVGERFYLPSRTMTEGCFQLSRPLRATITRSTMTGITARRRGIATCWRTGFRC